MENAFDWKYMHDCFTITLEDSAILIGTAREIQHTCRTTILVSIFSRISKL